MLFINHKEINDGNTVLIEIKGPLNTATSSNFEDYINGLLEKQKYYFILDAGSMEYVSSQGIGVMLFIQKKLAARNGCFVLCNLHSEIMILYRLLGFDRVLTIARSVEDAVQIMQRQIEMRGSMPPPVPEPEESREAGERAAEQGIAREREEPGDSPEFDHPLIVECAHCRGLVRVKHGGVYECPYCHTEFAVEKDQTIIF
jgi:anti-sigma B factor antagonist/stage II sporulation protein AA (anti-sigma F factor antagonist)